MQGESAKDSNIEKESFHNTNLNNHFLSNHEYKTQYDPKKFKNQPQISNKRKDFRSRLKNVLRK
jgi:hypothetical protein